MSSHTAMPPPYPDALAPYAGQINDIDSHECTPIQNWTEEFGAAIGPLRDACLPIANQHAGRATDAAMPPPLVDDQPIDAQTVWQRKMEYAPGAFEFQRRLRVLDLTGVKRQILFPGAAGVFAHALINKADDPAVFASITADRKAYGTRMVDLYNDWCARQSRQQDRVRPAAILVGDSPAELHARLRCIVDSGVRAVMISPDTPPGGVSPAHPDLDPVWSLAASAGCPILAHIAISENFLRTMTWREAPDFDGWKVGGEFSLDPWTLSTIHFAVQNYVTTMVMGGVFQRHPKLAFGCAEFTGHWVGPMAENLDRWHLNSPFPSNKAERPLKRMPSEFLRENLRVMSFDFEPVGDYIKRYGLEEMYCYASDFPHHEGGKDPMNRFLASLEGHSPETVRRFFVENGKTLLPD